MSNIIKVIATSLLVCCAVNVSVAQFTAVRILQETHLDYYRYSSSNLSQISQGYIHPDSPTIQVLKMLYPSVSSYLLPEHAKHIEYNLIMAQMSDLAYIAAAEKMEAYIVLAYNKLPSYRIYSETQHFRRAYSELTDMLEDKVPIDLKRAIFVVEDAFTFGKLNYDSYLSDINEMVRLCKLKIKQKKLDPNDNMVKNMMLFHFLSDTFKVRDPVTEKLITRYPIRYDTEDFDGSKDANNFFVTKLLNTGVGQCNSMPLLYLILAKEMGAEAYLSYSPRHSFIKIKDQNNSWYNIELTCGYFLSDQHYMNSSFIKAEAIRNKIYLHPLDEKEVIANILMELSYLYRREFGFDEFTKQCYEKAMPYASNSKTPLRIKMEYEDYFATFVINMLQYRNLDEFKEKDPQIYDRLVVQGIRKTDAELERYGYEDMPKEMYEQWLARMREKRNEYQTKEQMNLRKTVQ